jgi:hypothetical protein
MCGAGMHHPGLLRQRWAHHIVELAASMGVVVGKRRRRIRSIAAGFPALLLGYKYPRGFVLSTFPGSLPSQ